MTETVIYPEEKDAIIGYCECGAGLRAEEILEDGGCFECWLAQFRRE